MSRKKPSDDIGVEPVDAVDPADDSLDDVTYDRVFRALSNSTRRRILDLLRDRPLTTGDLCSSFPGFDRCTTMQHLGVLEQAGLVIIQRKGRERWNHLDVLPIKNIHDRWIGDYARSAVGLLAGLQHELEQRD
ncbi:MAG: ArsR family transcriptional regulator [Acidimicrobiales bacterium]|jgi:DNA-binding transcriptional ArsR family regulator|nr:ArsR family transcriptional regulator [Acidimicrobiales bacterium]